MEGKRGAWVGSTNDLVSGRGTGRFASGSTARRSKPRSRDRRKGKSSGSWRSAGEGKVCTHACMRESGEPWSTF